MVIPNTLWYSSLLSLLTLLSCQSSSSINRKNTTYLFVLHQYVSIINLNYKKEEAMGFRVRLTSNFLPPSSRRDPRHQEDFERIFKSNSTHFSKCRGAHFTRPSKATRPQAGEGEGELAARTDNVRGAKGKTVCAPTTTREPEEN